MNIPQFKDIDTALYIYYSFPELSTKEIALLFNNKSKSTIHRMKKLAMEVMVENDIKIYGTHKVNTQIAYKAWGIDVMDLEQRREKLKQLNLR